MIAKLIKIKLRIFYVIFARKLTIIAGLLCFISNPALATPQQHKNLGLLVYNSEFNTVFVQNKEHKSHNVFSWDKFKSWGDNKLIVIQEYNPEDRKENVKYDFYDLQNKGMDIADDISSDFLILKALNNNAQIKENSLIILASIKNIRSLLTIIAKFGYENRGQELLLNEYLIPKEKPRVSKEEEAKTEIKIMDELREESYALYLLKTFYLHIQTYVFHYAVALAVLAILLFLIMTKRIKKKKHHRRSSSKSEKTMEIKNVRRKRRRRKRRRVITIIEPNNYKEIKRKKEEYLKNEQQTDKEKSKDVETRLVYSFYI